MNLCQQVSGFSLGFSRAQSSLGFLNMNPICIWFNQQEVLPFVTLRCDDCPITVMNCEVSRGIQIGFVAVCLEHVGDDMDYGQC